MFLLQHGLHFLSDFRVKKRTLLFERLNKRKGVPFLQYPLESQSLFCCIPTLYINHHRNIDVVFNHLISDFITLTSEDDMLEKVPKTKDFYVSARCINTIVSTCAADGNISTQQTFSNRYPFSCNTARSLTRLVGLQLM